MSDLELHKREEDDDKTQFAHKRQTDGWRRWRPLLAYLILVAAIVWIINDVRNEGIQRRTDLGNSARVVVLEGCQRDNDTRKILRELIMSSDKALDQYAKEGLLTKEQAARAKQENAIATKKLRSVDCQSAADQLVIEPSD